LNWLQFVATGTEPAVRWSFVAAPRAVILANAGTAARRKRHYHAIKPQASGR
jgi:hypothetical protein